MGSPLFYDVTYTGTGAQTALPTNRWGDHQYSITVIPQPDPVTSGEYTVQGTINRINRSTNIEPTVWFDLDGFVGLTGQITGVFKNTPLEALRLFITTNDESIRFQVMQGGET